MDLEGLELGYRSEIFTRSEEILATQHTRKSASSDQNSSQERPEGIFFVTDYTEISKSAYALRISTLNPYVDLVNDIL